MLSIEKYKSPSLSRKARPVKPEEFRENLDKFMSDMATLMYSSRGVGLAAPQVNSELRVLVADMSYLDYRDYGAELVKIVNPVIIWKSDTLIKAAEQCLSFPDLEVLVERPDEISISYQTPFGDQKEVTYKGWQARVILHEIDHFDGVTLYTRSSSLKRKKYQKIMESK
jgi:peptide deformylase